MSKRTHFVLGMLVLPLLLVGLGIGYAASVSTPNNFVAGTPVLAAEVNANFAAHAAGINDNDSRISALEATHGVLPSFRATVSDALFTGMGVIIFDSEEHDDGGIYNPTTGVFTAPKAGVYHLAFSTLAFGAGQVVILSMHKNGTTEIGSTYINVDAQSEAAAVAITVKLAAGDTVSISRNQTVDLRGTLGGGNLVYTTFSGHLIQDL